MMKRTELHLEYNEAMKLVSATCEWCGEKMPSAPADLQNAADIIMWLSRVYIEHHRLKYSHEDRRRATRD